MGGGPSDSIVRGASAHDTVLGGLRHAAYAAGWKKFEPLWDFVIRAKRAGMMLPFLETILSEFGHRPSRTQTPASTEALTPPVRKIYAQSGSGAGV